MKRNVKKVVSVVVASSMLLSLAACSDKAKDEVIEAADSFGAAVVKLNADKLFKLTTIDDEEDQDALAMLFTYDDDAVRNAIVSNISYEVDEDSAEGSTKDGEGSVDVIFTLPDYEAVFDETEAADEDELIDELGDADTQEIKVTVEFELDDDEWLVSNADKVLDKVFGDVYDVELPAFVPSYNPADFQPDWWFEDSTSGNDAYYTNTDEIDMDLYYVGTEDFDSSLVYYTITFEGTVIYTSDLDRTMGYWNEYYGAELNEDGYLNAGDYTVTFYIGDAVILEGTAHVSVEEVTFNPDDVYFIWYGLADREDENEAWYSETTYFDADIHGIDTSSVFYTVELNGQLLYTSDIGDWEGYYRIGVEAPDTESGYLDEGDYVITFFVGNEQVGQAIAHVGEAGSGNIGGTGAVTDPVAQFMDTDFEDSVIDACWYDPDTRYFLDSIMYDSGVSYVSYSIEVDSDVTDSIYYAFYYSADANTEPDIEGDPIYSATITPSSYTDGTFYDIDCNSGADGAYIVVVATDSSLNNPLLVSVCYVG